MGRWVKSDDELIEHIRKQQRWQRPTAIALMVLGVVVLVASFWFIWEFRARSMALAQSFSTVRQPTTQQSEAITTDLVFNLGMSLGFLLATGLSTGVSFAMAGSAMLFVQRRRDRLLLEAWDARTGRDGRA